MNRKDKETADKIRNKIEEFDVSNPLPLELSKENITEALKQQPQQTKKSGRILEMKRLTSVAAAIVIVFGAVTAFNLFGGSSGLQKALDSLKGSGLTGQTAGIEAAKSEKQILDIFSKLSKDASRTQNYSGFDALFGNRESKAVDSAAPESDGGMGGGDENSDYGQTNVQVKGIDEPDVMKNDGKYMYTVSNGVDVNIFNLLPADGMKLASTIKFGETKGKSEYVSSLFVKGDLLVVFGTLNTYIPYEDIVQDQPATKPEEPGAVEPQSGVNAPDAVEPYEGSGTGSSGSDDMTEPAQAPDEEPGVDSRSIMPYYYYGYNSKTESFCMIYDISDRAAPKLVKKISQDGSFITARLIGNELYFLSSYYIDVYSNRNLEDVCIPAVTVDGKSQNIPAADISITKNPEPSYLIVCGVNLDDLKAEPNKKAVLGGGSEAYCTADSLFVSRSVYAGGVQTRDWGSDIAITSSSNNYSTEIYRFAIGGGKVAFKDSGKVAGQILNQFSMDEYNGYFRIATTQGDWQSSSSNVFVLNDKLQVVGKIENIAPKERIFAVRFMGDTGYVVTFEQVDPLFVIDLKDPKAPKIVGELKIPGFSSYLHPITDTLLFGVGQNGDDKGTLPGIKLSLFDVSDPQKPKEVDTLILQGDGYTEAANNHRAFMTYPEKGIFGFPVMKYNYVVYYDNRSGDVADGSATSSIGSDYMASSFETYRIQGNKIVPVMSYKEDYQQPMYSSYYYGGITRGTYIGDTLYTLSGAALSSFDMASGKAIGALQIKQPAYNYYDYGYDYGIKEPVAMD